MYVEILGWICVVVGVSAFVPQVVAVLRRGTTAGLSLTGMQMGLGATGAWIVHGMLYGHIEQVLTNVLILLGLVLIVGLMQRERQLGLVQSWWLAAATFPVLVAVDVLLGSAAFGMFVVIPNVVVNLLGFLELVRSPSIRGVSWQSLALNGLTQALWVTWSLMVSDPGATIASGVFGVGVAMSLTWYWLRHSGRVQ
ncbi:MAG TPA: PQ-loop repeat-containing protein, partial [Propionibacteriaceae bacterium]|nr:PQ-loop repeat-containing protein [Propionibacteriaceae bacterium]